MDVSSCFSFPHFHCFFGLKDPDWLTDEQSTSMITDTDHVNSESNVMPKPADMLHRLLKLQLNVTKTVSNQLVSLCEVC